MKQSCHQGGHTKGITEDKHVKCSKRKPIKLLHVRGSKTMHLTAKIESQKWAPKKCWHETGETVQLSSGSSQYILSITNQVCVQT